MMTTTSLSAEKSRELLASMSMSDSDRSAREELTAAGVSEGRIDALYPITFSHFAQRVTARLRERGPDHLAIKHIDGTRWWEYRTMVRLMENQLPKDVRQRKEDEYLAQWEVGLAGREMVDLVYAETLLWYEQSVANAYAAAFGMAAFGAYWFTVHPERAREAGGMEALARSFVNQLLPPGSV